MSDITDYDVDLMMQRVRRETIEECARVAEKYMTDVHDEIVRVNTLTNLIAVAIRALKERQ